MSLGENERRGFAISRHPSCNASLHPLLSSSSIVSPFLSPLHARCTLIGKHRPATLIAIGRRFLQITTLVRRRANQPSRDPRYRVRWYRNEPLPPLPSLPPNARDTPPFSFPLFFPLSRFVFLLAVLLFFPPPFFLVLSSSSSYSYSSFCSIVSYFALSYVPRKQVRDLPATRWFMVLCYGTVRSDIWILLFFLESILNYRRDTFDRVSNRGESVWSIEIIRKMWLLMFDVFLSGSKGFNWWKLFSLDKYYSQWKESLSFSLSVSLSVCGAV